MSKAASDGSNDALTIGQH